MVRNIRNLRVTVPVIALITILLVSFSYAPDIRIDKILHQLEVFRLTRTQQKVYLHTDKNNYIAGENIWVKAYVINASDFSNDSISKEVYVDLIDYSNQQVHTEILRNKDGFAEGYFHLSDTLAEGNYQIRAYTNWMRNFDEAYFFSKTINFKNPNYENVITKARLNNIKQFNRKYKKIAHKHVVNFFPEGGQMVAGLPVVVAYKAENMAGYSMNVTGVIVDNKGKEVADFKSVHEGMGTFTLTPETDMKYTAKVTFENGSTEKFSLPEVLPQGTVVKIDPFDPNVIKLSILSNKPVSNDVYANEFIVVFQSRGMAQYVSKAQWEGKPIDITVEKKLFPTGIVQITIFDGRSNPVCERIAFVEQPQKLNVITRSKNNGTAPNDSLEMEIVVVDRNGNPVEGNISLAVTERTEKNTFSTNIMNTLFLSSDVRGRVNNPGYYFDKSNPESVQHRDMLLLTQGWRRFVWADLLANRLPAIQYTPSEGLSVGGVITRDFFGIPINNSKVRMTVLSSYNDEYETLTDNGGRFNFPDLDYEDTITVKIEAFKPAGGKGVLIILSDTAVPKVKTPTLLAMRNEVYPKEKIKHNVRKERMVFKKNYKGKPEPDITIPKIHSTPNDVIYVGQEAASYSNVFQYLQGRVPGVSVVGNKITIRGVNSFYLPTDPLYLLDGIPVETGTVGALSPLDLSVIEILKGPEAAIYGSRGANGVIAFYTKRGRFMKRGVIDFGMQGYQKSKEFYVAPYERFGYLTSEHDVPKTIYWKPTIRTDESGKATVKFKRLPKTENYNFIIEGLTTEGEIIYYIGE
jgi:TonB-dependent SusC/RagA subfamily outer membrane receptor